MLFAWAEEDNKIYKFLKLDTLEKMGVFFAASRDVVFVYDQLNALETDHNMLQWLTRFRFRQKRSCRRQQIIKRTWKRVISNRPKRQ